MRPLVAAVVVLAVALVLSAGIRPVVQRPRD